MTPTRLILLVLLSFGLCQCGSTNIAKVQKWAQPKKATSFWKGDEVSGKPKIVIDLSAQRLRYYKGGQLVGEAPVSSGREGNSTTNGSFKVTEKDIDHRSSIYGAYVAPDGSVVVDEVDSRIDPRPPGTRYVGANMRYFMRFNGGIGMHEGYLPGYPDSHGCIRLPTDMARIFYEATPYGTPVIVKGSGNLAGSEAPIRIGEGTLPGSRESVQDATGGSDRSAPRPPPIPSRTFLRAIGGSSPKLAPGTTLYLN
jgi:hypothetical protein